MKLKLFDYKRRVKVFEIGDLESIAKIVIEVITGDEVAWVFYKDFTEDILDSCENRMCDCYDGRYVIYDFKKPNEENLLFNQKWLNRYTSYDFQLTGF